MEYVDLYTLQRDIKEGLGDLFPEKIWVCAEVAAIQVRSNGHCYLDLVQSERGVQKAKVKAIIWGGKYPFLSKVYRDATGSRLDVGHQVLVRVQVNYSELYGLSLIIDDINPEYTIGDAEKQKQKTIERLKKEGLLDKQSALRMTALPYRLAVISAQDAAGYGDFCNHLKESGFAFKVELVQASMQGFAAPESIAAALKLVGDSTLHGSAENEYTGEYLEGAFDAVLLLRGGGSALDLACFDDYGLCAAIARCPVPVFTAIGHDKDYHVADMAAYRFVKTPTALADEFIQIYEAEDEMLGSIGSRLKRAFTAKIAAEEYRIRMSVMRVKQAFAGKIALQESWLQRTEARIASADPRALLKRGYTLVTDSRGVLLKSVAPLKPGDKISVRMADGRVEAEIQKIGL